MINIPLPGYIYRMRTIMNRPIDQKTTERFKQPDQNALRTQYKLSDFPQGFVRGRYAEQMRESSNVVVLKPEVAEVFPNEEAVNNALSSLIEMAKKSTGKTKG